MYHLPSILNGGQAKVRGTDIFGTAIPRLMRAVLDTKILVEFGEPFEGSTALNDNYREILRVSSRPGKSGSSVRI